MLLLISTSLLLPAAASTQDNIEHKLKAAFLLNFAKFTDWPTQGSGTQEFTFCAAGDSDELQPYMGLSKKTVQGKPIRLALLQGHSEPETCQVLFISRSSAEVADHILQKTDGKPVLLVSDIQAFIEMGGIIEFEMRGSRLGFIINNTKAGKVGLTISSSLLNLAAEVK